MGPLTATALVASIADAHSFKNGRQLAAWLGLVPRQHSSGGKATLLGISKRGDVYLRTLLIHIARAALSAAKRHATERVNDFASPCFMSLLWKPGCSSRRFSPLRVG